MFTNPVEVSIVSGLIFVLGVIIWWWFQRIVTNLDGSASRQHELALSIAKICGTITQIAQWQEFHEKTDSERHTSHTDAIEQLRDAVRARGREVHAEHTWTSLEVPAGAHERT